MTTSQSRAIRAQRLTRDIAQSLLRHTDEDELALNVKCGKELVEGEQGRGSGDDDEVEFALEVLLEAGCGGNETFGAHLEGILLLCIGSREDGDLGAQCGTEQNRVVAAIKDISASPA